jgi:hypothetical protein
MSKAPKSPKKPSINRTAQAAIGHQLRAMYSDLVMQPLPEKLLTTLRAMQKAENAQARTEGLREAA